MSACMEVKGSFKQLVNRTLSVALSVSGEGETDDGKYVSVFILFVILVFLFFFWSISNYILLNRHPPSLYIVGE